jgi:hypothetical protein
VSLGVSLGNSNSECITSAKLIKDFELERTLTMLKRSHLVDSNGNASLCLAVSRDLTFVRIWRGTMT